MTGTGFAFFAFVRLRWPRLPLSCQGIHCRVAGCGVRHLAETRYALWLKASRSFDGIPCITCVIARRTSLMPDSSGAGELTTDE
jgi:hypothetical protein